MPSETRVPVLRILSIALHLMALAAGGVGALWIHAGTHPPPGGGSLGHVGITAMGFALAFAALALALLGLYLGQRARPKSPDARIAYGALAREALRTGIAAGLAMVPFAAVFRAQGLRVNEYGRKTLELLVGAVPQPVYYPLTLVQHLAISVLVAVPLVLLLRGNASRRARLAVGTAYGAGFYVAVNSLALPFVFGDPTPWELGFATVYPSLAIHLVYGFVAAWVARGDALRNPVR